MTGYKLFNCWFPITVKLIAKNISQWIWLKNVVICKTHQAAVISHLIRSNESFVNAIPADWGFVYAALFFFFKWQVFSFLLFVDGL